MEMRLRLPELFEEKNITPYRVAKDSGGRISLSNIYRLKRDRGQLETFRKDMLTALCDVLHVTPGELFSRDDEAPPPKPKPSKHR